jgi:hypothetical protein
LPGRAAKHLRTWGNRLCRLLSPARNAPSGCARSWLHDHAHAAPQIEVRPGDLGHLEPWRVSSRQLHDAGFAGLSWSAEFGGKWLPPSYQAIWAVDDAGAFVVISGGAQPSAYLVERGAVGVAIQRRSEIDPSTQLAEVRLDHTPAVPLLADETAAQTLARVLDRATLFACAETTGIAEASNQRFTKRRNRHGKT